MGYVSTTTAVLRVDPELWLFLTARRYDERVLAPTDGTATLGHLAESVGIPRTEVGVFRVAGAEASPHTRAVPDSVIEVLPVARPQCRAERFALDVHLGKLARRMRLLGIDSAYRNDAGDDELIARAGAERRVLLTRDRGLLRRRALRAGAHVRGTRPWDQLADVLSRFAPPLAPWTRCTSCNGLLTAVPKQEVAEELHSGTLRCYNTYARCASCGHVYWRGAHSDRIQTFIAAARALHPCPNQ